MTIKRIGMGAMLALAGWLFVSPLEVHADPVTERPTERPTERTERTFEIPAFGRAAIVVSSAHGTAVQYLDQMMGPGDPNGVPGERDGRIDQFLSPGKHKVWLTAPAGAKTNAEIKIVNFQELNTGAAPVLVHAAMASAALGDFQQRSYWLEVTEAKTIFLEAAGRYLSDLRVWKDGVWLMPFSPQVEELQGRPGQPLALRRIETRLEPGLYLVTAYGGAGLAWTEASTEQPFFIRLGIPELPSPVVRPMVASPFGLDHWLVVQEADTFRLDLPSPQSAEITAVADHVEAHADHVEAHAAMDKTSREGMAQARFGFPKTNTRVTVRRAAGEPYILSAFDGSPRKTFKGPQNALLSLFLPKPGEDLPDVTAVLTESNFNTKPYIPEHVVAENAIVLDAHQAWRRRFNLLQPVKLFLSVKTPGWYTVSSEGVKAQFRIAPLLGGGEKLPETPPQVGTATWQLSPRVYELTIVPELEVQGGLGILTLDIRGEKAARAKEITPALNAITFAPMVFDKDREYVLRLSNASGVGNAIFKLPLSLEQEVPLTLASGKTLRLEVDLPSEAMIEAVSLDGLRLPLTLVSKDPVSKDPVSKDPPKVLSLKPGKVTLEIANPQKTPVTVLLRRVPPAPVALQPLPEKRIAEIPALPSVQPGTPVGFDLGRKESKLFALNVAQPAFYRVESTGRLAVTGSLRTRLRPSLAKNSGLGVGENLLVQQYLSPGLYQVNVEARRETMGHLGLAVSASPLRDGGGLVLGTPARVALQTGEGIAYGFEIPKAGTYSITSMTLGAPASLRLEDAEGWSLTRPNQEEVLEQWLEPGKYRLIVMPQGLATRMVTVVKSIETPAPLQGHGPHPLPLGKPQTLQWMESGIRESRTPDAWTFVLPADVEVTLTLSDLMQGGLFREDDFPTKTGTFQKVAAFDFRNPLKRELKAGSYRLETESIRANNRLDYTVDLQVNQLTVGEEREVTLPAEIPVSIGDEKGLLEFVSFGPIDVRTILLEEGGKEVTRGDDRPGDWNFALATPLHRGKYTLKVMLANPSSGDDAYDRSTRVRLSRITEVTEPTLELEANTARTRTFADGAVHLIPLELPAKGGEMLVAGVTALEAQGVTLQYRSGEEEWQNASTVSGTQVRVGAVRSSSAKEAWRLRVWPMDQTKKPVTVTIAAVSPPSSPLETKGISLREVPGLSPPSGVALVSLSQPGLFRLDRRGEAIAWNASQANPGLSTGGGSIALATQTRMWLLGMPGQSASLEPLSLESGAPLTLSLTQDEIAKLPLGGGGLKLWIGYAALGQPLLRPAASDEDARDARGSGFAPGSTAVVTGLAGETNTQIHLKRIDHAEGALSVTLRQVQFGTPVSANLPLGMTDETLPVGGAKLYALPPGNKRLRLALPPATAAVLLPGAKRETQPETQTVWSGQEDWTETLETASESMLLLNAGTEPASVSVLVEAIAERELTLVKDQIFHRWNSDTGTIRLSLDSQGDAGVDVLHLLGTGVERVMAVDRGGALSTNPQGVGKAATLWVRTRPGMMALWFNARPETAFMRKSGPVKPAPALPGTLTVTEANQTWSIPGTKPGLLHIRGDGPMMTQTGGSVELWSHGPALNVFLSGKETLLDVSSLGKGAPSGTLRLTRSEPLPLKEGLGTKIRLAPGDARLFTFQIETARPIGVGVRGKADSARVRLFNEQGEALAEGTIAMSDLQPGRYFLLVENRLDAPGVEIQPVLVGLDAPGNGPPEDVKRTYWDMVSGEGTNGQ